MGSRISFVRTLFIGTKAGNNWCNRGRCRSWSGSRNLNSLSLLPSLFGFLLGLLGGLGSSNGFWYGTRGRNFILRGAWGLSVFLRGTCSCNLFLHNCGSHNLLGGTGGHNIFFRGTWNGASFNLSPILFTDQM